MTQTYAIFAFDQHYPTGGYQDCRAVFHDIIEDHALDCLDTYIAEMKKADWQYDYVELICFSGPKIGTVKFMRRSDDGKYFQTYHFDCDCSYCNRLRK